MKTALSSLAFVLSFSMQAQIMNTPDQAIIQLFASTDLQDWSILSEVFSEEIVLDYSSMTGDPAKKTHAKDVIKAWKGLLPGFDHTHHQIGNLQVTEEGQKAKVTCYGTASHFLKDEAVGIWKVYGTYDFKLKKNQTGVWKVTHMTFNFKFQEGNQDLPAKAIAKLKS